MYNAAVVGFPYHLGHSKDCDYAHDSQYYALRYTADSLDSDTVGAASTASLYGSGLMNCAVSDSVVESCLSCTIERCD